MHRIWIFIGSLLLATSANAGEFGWGIFASGMTLSGDQPWQQPYRECREHHQGHCQIDIPDPYCTTDDCSVIAIEWTVKYLLSQPPYDAEDLDYAHNVQCTGTSNGRAKCFTRLPINAPFQHMHRRDSGIMMPGHALLSPSLSETREAYGWRHWWLPYPDPIVFYSYFDEGGKTYGLNYLKHGRNPRGLEGKLDSVFSPEDVTTNQVATGTTPQPATRNIDLQPSLQGEKLNGQVEQALEKARAL